MKKLIITIENHEQLKTILSVLDRAEAEGEIEFSFNAFAVDVDSDLAEYSSNSPLNK